MTQQQHYKYHRTHFLKSAINDQSLPIDIGIEVAFVGRTNAGKSSLLNTLTNNKNLARTSKTPGRTQMVNFFEIEKNIRLVDLPGYGYSNVSEKMKEKQQSLLEVYLRKRSSLKGLVIMMDIRHPLQNTDREMIKLAMNCCNISVMVLLSKSDKIPVSHHRLKLHQISTILLSFRKDVQIGIFSSLKRQGVVELRRNLDHWFNHHKNNKTC